MLRDALLLVSLLAAMASCRADADDTPHMGSRWVGPVEQPTDLLDGWRCDLYRGFRDWPAGIGCHPAKGEAFYVSPPPGETMPMLTHGQVWDPQGLDDGWNCAEWRYLDTALWSACYPLENP